MALIVLFALGALLMHNNSNEKHRSKKEVNYD